MRSKAEMSYCLTPVRRAVIKTAEKGNLCSVDRDVNCCSHYGKEYGGVLKKLKRELPYDPAIPRLGIYLRETKSLS